jgi:predicted naringenin-chalcone synthase
MKTVLMGIGTAQPASRITQDEALVFSRERFARSEREARLLTALYRRSGVHERALTVAEPDCAAFPGDDGRPQVHRHGYGASHTHHEDEAGKVDTERSFYPATRHAEDCGPTTAERMRCYAAHATPLAARACRAALADAAVGPEMVTHLITASCTGFSAPGVDLRLIRTLGLPPTTRRTHIGFMGCHGAFNALQVGRSHCLAHRAAVVLVASVELCSLHFTYGFEPDRLVANALFADGAGAAVLRRGQDERGDTQIRDGAPAKTAGSAWSLTATGSCLLEASEREMTWDIGDHGFEMTLSSRVPEVIGAQLRPWLTHWLGEQGLGLRDVGSWAVHPGGPRVLAAVERALDLPTGATQVSRDVLRESGNMSSATVLFIVERLMRRDAARPCVALGFGPGLVAETMLFR